MILFAVSCSQNKEIDSRLNGVWEAQTVHPGTQEKTTYLYEFQNNEFRLVRSIGNANQIELQKGIYKRNENKGVEFLTLNHHLDSCASIQGGSSQSSLLYELDDYGETLTIRIGLNESVDFRRLTSEEVYQRDQVLAAAQVGCFISNSQGGTSFQRIP